MGGDISVSSQLGKGSIFRFEINIQEGREGAMAKKAEARRVTGLQPGQKIRRILIADDKDDNRVLLSQMLGSIGFDVREVENGEQAVREFEKWRPHMILMDMRMPVMDGLEAIKRIRSSIDGEKVKIVSVTASAFDEDRTKALEIGADDFLGKPFREEVLLEKIKALLTVEYVYADEPSAPKPEKDALGDLLKEKVAALPETLVNQLHNATLSADLDRILELIHQIEKHDVNVAGRMRNLAEGFDYQELLEITTRQNVEV
jgi:CheY-like chemotaxis protein